LIGSIGRRGEGFRRGNELLPFLRAKKVKKKGGPLFVLFFIGKKKRREEGVLREAKEQRGEGYQSAKKSYRPLYRRGKPLDLGGKEKN